MCVQQSLSLSLSLARAINADLFWSHSRFALRFGNVYEVHQKSTPNCLRKHRSNRSPRPYANTVLRPAASDLPYLAGLSGTRAVHRNVSHYCSPNKHNKYIAAMHHSRSAAGDVRWRRRTHTHTVGFSFCNKNKQTQQHTSLRRDE